MNNSEKLELNNGDITVYNCNCFDLLDDLIKNNVKIDSILTDPPYSMMKGDDNKPHIVETSPDWDLFSNKAYQVLKDNSFFTYFQIFKFALENDFFGKTLKNGFKIYENVIWDKTQCGNPFLDFQKSHEEIYIFKKGNPKINPVSYNHFIYELDNEDQKEVFKIFDKLKDLQKIFSNYDSAMDFIKYLYYKTHPISDEEFNRIFNNQIKAVDTSFLNFRAKIKPNKSMSACKQLINGSRLKSVIRMVPSNKSGANTEKYKHPNVKPVELMELIIKQTTNEGDLILDPFLGSGTTAQACINTNRRFIGCELNKEYFEIVKNRLS